MNCIRCNQPLTQEQYEGVDIDRCGKCQGVWLDAGELAKIVGTVGEHFSNVLISETLKGNATGIPQNEKESKELCPKCSVEMTPINYSYQSGVIIDSCPNGHGLWFDSKELEKVQIFKESEDDKLKQNRNEWQKIANDAKQSAQTSITGSSAIDKISQFIMDWLG